VPSLLFIKVKENKLVFIIRAINFVFLISVIMASSSQCLFNQETCRQNYLSTSVGLMEGYNECGGNKIECRDLCENTGCAKMIATFLILHISQLQANDKIFNFF
jgi:uncharacterized membrane protein